MVIIIIIIIINFIVTTHSVLCPLLCY